MSPTGNRQQFAMDYIDVATRIVEFREKHPEGSLQQVSIDFREFAGLSWVIFTAAAYRSPDDPRPGHGTAWEQVPGITPFTKGSEVQNAETAAWGRALVASLAADTKRGIASAEEVRGSRERQSVSPADALRDELRDLCGRRGLDLLQVAQDFSDGHDGKTLKDADAKTVKAFLELVKSGIPGEQMTTEQKAEHKALVADTLAMERPAERLQGLDPEDPWAQDDLPTTTEAAS